jgi:hypothetical protein
MKTQLDKSKSSMSKTQQTLADYLSKYEYNIFLGDRQTYEYRVCLNRGSIKVHCYVGISIFSNSKTVAVTSNRHTSSSMAAAAFIAR